MAKVSLKEWADDEFAELLNEQHPDVDICGVVTKRPGDLLLEVDPIAFQEEKSNYEDANPMYVCEECGEEYDTEEDAEACCPDEDED